VASDPAIAAAQAVAREHGVACDDAVRLAGGSNALVHLRPAPVVARVMTGTVGLHDDPAQWLAREVAVGVFLAGTGLVVPPTDLLPPGPHERDGLWITLWTYGPHDEHAPPPAARELGRSLRALHAALAGFDGDLLPVSGIRDWLEGLLVALPDRDALRSRLEALTPAVFASPLPVQPLHGDISLGNVLRTDGRLLWNDLEDVCAGPVEWDVAGLVSSARARGCGERFVEEMLAAYGEVGDLQPFLEAHELYSTIWRAA
jgi:hypothetical protein